MIINKQQKLIGTLEYDPELRFTPYGNSVCNIYLRIDDQLFNCEIWRQLGEQAAEQLRGGDVITLEAKSRQHKWIDRDYKVHWRTIWTVSSYAIDKRS